MILFLLVALSDPASAKTLMSKSYSNLSLSFETNQGQTDDQVKFLSRGKGYTLFLTPTEAILVLRELQHITSTLNNHRETKPKETEEICSTMLRMKLEGANSDPKIVGMDELPGKNSYFIGNDPKRWRTKIPSYARVKYEGIYPGVDLIYYWNEGQLEYDFIVAPYADPNVIRLNFEGSDKLEMDSLGNLVFHMAGVDVRLRNPQSYQEIEGVRQAIPGHYVSLDNHQVGFRIASYDASKPLSIDPVLSYSTYLGGSGNDFGFGIAVDAAGNAYIAGITASIDFPVENPFQANCKGNPDIFITKMNANGSALVYSTYLGGSGDEGTSGDFLRRGIAVDSDGNAYVTNFTTSTDFPTTPGAFQVVHGGGGADAFVTKLNATGSALVYSTYLGGSNYDEGRSIAVDASGCAYVTGATSSTDFPISNPFQANNNGDFDVFVTKLASDGSSLIYSTYLGGSRSDAGTGIAVDSLGNAYITGGTNSTDYPTTLAAFQASAPGGGHPCIVACDAFVTKLNVNGSALIYSTYLGGSLDDAGSGIAIDGADNAYVTGVTSSADFPTTEGSFQKTFGGCNPCQFGDAFITKLDDTGSNLVYSSYLGGGGDDGGSGIAVDSLGNAYVTGTTRSPNFPTLDPIQPIFGGGNTNAFLTKVNTSGSALIYSTYFGGNFFDFGHDIALDPIGNAYFTGRTASSNFLTTPGAFQRSLGGGFLFDSFIVKVSDIIALQFPARGDAFPPCSMIPNYQPTFSWTTTGTFESYTILLSTSSTDFSTRGVLITKANVEGAENSWIPSITIWKKIMTSSWNIGTIRDIYWKVIGTESDRSTVDSGVRSFRIGASEPVTINGPANGAILSSSSTPTLDFNTNCNIKFKLEISPVGDFSDSYKIKSFSYTTRDPNVDQKLMKTLSSFQWNSVKKLIGTGTGYFRIKAWDALKRETISEIRSFTVQ